jgi:hypothetical protein
MASPLQNILLSPLFIYTGIFLSILSMGGVFFKKLPTAIGYDLFASSTLMIWFAYWKLLFNEDSPLFFFYPLYFVFMTTFVELFFIRQSHYIDNETFNRMQSLAENSLIQPWVIMLGVLVSLVLPQHYLLYPILMTLVMMRLVLAHYLESKK